jgi:predicted nucleic acid-binding protein
MSGKPVLLDNTVLTNFSLVDRLDLVLELWEGRCVTTSAVLAEYQAGVDIGRLKPAIWASLLELNLTEEEAAFAERLPVQLGAGERCCIAAAVYQDGRFASDDNLARREAQKHGVEVTGTVGILILNVQRGRLSLAEGNQLLVEMVAQGYRSPVKRLDKLV